MQALETLTWPWKFFWSPMEVTINITNIITIIFRGVMVIKQAGKTRAAQRKGALTNWKKTGRTIIKYLRYK